MSDWCFVPGTGNVKDLCINLLLYDHGSSSVSSVPQSSSQYIHQIHTMHNKVFTFSRLFRCGPFFPTWTQYARLQAYPNWTLKYLFSKIFKQNYIKLYKDVPNVRTICQARNNKSITINNGTIVCFFFLFFCSFVHVQVVKCVAT